MAQVVILENFMIVYNDNMLISKQANIDDNNMYLW